MYRISANETDVLDIRVFQPEFVTVRLYGPNRTQIASESNGLDGRTPRLVKKLPDTGTYYVEVIRDSSSSQQQFSYTLQVNRVTPVENDQFGPNGGFEAAAAVSNGSYDGTLWDSESDYFAVDANETDALDLSVSQPSFVTVRLYRPNRSQIASSSTSLQGRTTRLVEKLPENGTYYVEITRRSSSNQQVFNYTLSVNRVTPDKNDQFAPNGGFDSAATISAQSNNGTIWGGESDYFKVGLNASETISIALTPDNGFVTVRMFDPDRNQIGNDDPFLRGGTATLTRTASERGTYYVVVDGSGRSQVGYELESNRTGTLPQQPTSIVDRFDTNNTPGIQVPEVLNAIVEFNRGQISQGDILRIIVALNS
ncbi:hypothetical protein [Haloarcula pelagica]|uniref:hypothetical protein n=1 Tax=Haloarcula pelagica TaxID=3033389 RepID=UPI0024C2951A|nr:hypothetical protein [Halomicroarcula sp. YJ-61-S]